MKTTPKTAERIKPPQRYGLAKDTECHCVMEPWDRGDWIYYSDHLKLKAELERERQQVRDALKGLFGMVETGVLVRNTSHDHDPKWYLKAMELTQALCKVQAALAMLEPSREGK